MESRFKPARRCLEEKELSELIQKYLNSNCRLAHTTLLDSIAILNRYLFKSFGDAVPSGGIFSKNPESIRDKVTVGIWMESCCIPFLSLEMRSRHYSKGDLP